VAILDSQADVKNTAISAVDQYGVLLAAQ